MTDENLDKIAESGIYNERGLRAVKVQNHEEEMLLMFTTGIDEKMHTVTNEDVFASFNYLLNLMDGHGTGDDIDHLATVVYAALANCCKTSSVSVSPVWSV